MVAATIAFFIFGGASLVNVSEILNYYDIIDEFLNEHFVLALIAFTVFYALFVAILVVPPSAPLSLLSGLLFGVVGGTLICMVAKTIGGTIAFIGWRYSFRGYEQLMSPRVMKLSDMISRRGFWYLMVIRVMPLLPFGTVTLAATFTRIRLPTFIGATFVGQGPASFIYAGFGASLAELLSRGDGVGVDSLDLGMRFLVPTIVLIVISVAGVALGHLLDPERVKTTSNPS